MNLEVLKLLWPCFFPRDLPNAIHPQDPRIEIIQCFIHFFQQDTAGKSILLEKADELLTLKRFYLDVQVLNQSLPFSDFEITLINRPIEISGCMGLAISIIANEKYPFLERKIVILAAFYNLSKSARFEEIKASRVGQLVSLEGQVLRVSNCKIMVDSGLFKCAKCSQSQMQYFEDGIFTPPAVCKTKKCYNKYLEFDRSSATLSDYQTIKLNAIDSQLVQKDSKNKNLDGSYDNDTDLMVSNDNSDHQAPRMIEVELRGDLVNTVNNGDCIRIVGVVNTMQMEGGRYFQSGQGGGGRGYKESAMHVLYINTHSIESLSNRSTSSKNDMGSSIIRSGGKNGSQEDFTDEKELAWIRELALSNRAMQTLVHSLCPAIYGHELVKLGLILTMLGGTDQSEYHHVSSTDHDSCPKIARKDCTIDSEGSFVRNNIHILIVGDPGLGKSQMLRAAASVSPRSVLVTGNTSSAAGLTATMTRDNGRGSASGRGGASAGGSNASIEAGALVLADEGLCCIDELDKITCDAHVLLEAMEQQTVSVAKAGMVCQLRCRAAVAAAANPVQGHYNRRRSVAENLKMNAALLSRFDLIFILLDRPDEAYDKLIGEHVFEHSHQNEERDMQHRKRQRMISTQDFSSSVSSTVLQAPAEETLTLSQRLKRAVNQLRNERSRLSSDNANEVHELSFEQMKRYIQYARQYCHPMLSRGAAKILQKMYLSMRAEDTAHSSCGSGGLPVTTRHLESLIRLSQARAKIDLREEVSEEDAQDVVQLLQESMLDVLTNELGEIDVTRRGGMSLSKQMKALVQAMAKEVKRSKQGNCMFTRQEIQELTQLLRLDKEVDALIDLMRTECYLLLKGPRLYELRIT